jgi:hypothetical protein
LVLHQVSNDVRLAHVQQKVVPKDERPGQLDKGSITNPEVLYFVSLRVDIEKYLELPTSMLLLFILVLSWNHKIVYYLLLYTVQTMIIRPDLTSPISEMLSSLLVPVAPICLAEKGSPLDPVAVFRRLELDFILAAGLI